VSGPDLGPVYRFDTCRSGRPSRSSRKRQVDAEEDERFGDRRGDELPPELADPTKYAAA
jgi:hypothetical protein